jgi:ATP-binding cassette, subfamily C, bacteriocin exporter
MSDVMRYRTFLPHHHLILDAPVAAVLLTILGLSFSFFIQALVDSFFVLEHQPTSNWLGLGMLLVTLARAGVFVPRSYLSAHLSWRINVETVNGHHRHPLGLPFTFFSSQSAFC